jgi:hypothetical protein
MRKKYKYKYSSHREKDKHDKKKSKEMLSLKEYILYEEASYNNLVKYKRAKKIY